MVDSLMKNKAQKAIQQGLMHALALYTQVTSICLIQSEVTELNSRKTTKRNSELFPSCLTQEVGSVTRSQRASVLSSQTLLTILNVEPLYLRIVAAPEN